MQTKNDAAKRIEQLKKVINHHRYLYHVLDSAEISDSALDSLKHELVSLEESTQTFAARILLVSELVANHSQSLRRSRTRLPNGPLTMLLMKMRFVLLIKGYEQTLRSLRESQFLLPIIVN